MWYFYVLLVVLVFLFLCKKSKKKSIHHCRVLVTGAGRGLGRALSLQLAREGCTLVLWDINSGLLADLQRELKLFSVEVETHCVDVGDEKAVSEAITKSSNIDIVINNAGVLGGRQFSQLSVNEIRRTVNVNAMGPVHVLKGLFPSFLSRRSGHIVTISSVMAQFYAAGLTDYCMSKAALAAFHNCLRLELRRLSMSNIHTTLVLPYTIDTGMFQGVKQPRLVSLVFPALTAEYVAARVVEAIQCQEELVVLPYLVAWAMPLVGLLPVRIRDLCTEYVGGGTGMDTFEGVGQN